MYVRMDIDLVNWKTQIRKGYLELCILLIVAKYNRVYGLELIEKLTVMELETKEGTLYPLLSRMTTDGVLSSVWETENLKGHPRKYYSLTKEGRKVFQQMIIEFEKMVKIFSSMN